MRQRTAIWIIESIKTRSLGGTICDFDHKDVDLRRGVSQARKRMTREGERCERVAWPKLFGAAGRESARAMRSAKVVDPPPRFGSGGTGDLDTNRGPPIPTPNAKKSTRVHTCVRVRVYVCMCVRVCARARACVCVKNFHSLERSLCDARNDDHLYPSGDDLGRVFRDFHQDQMKGKWNEWIFYNRKIDGWIKVLFVKWRRWRQ